MKKIAIASDDRKNIARRTGRAKEFVVFTLNDSNQIIDIDYRENGHAHHHHEEEEHHHGYGRRHGGKGRHHHGHNHEHHHGEHSHDEVVELLQDVDVLLYKALGKYMRKDLEEAQIPIKRVNGEGLEEIILEYVKNL
jgi:predicted Fe-Mo cluster-binding NifX family protein